MKVTKGKKAKKSNRRAPLLKRVSQRYSLALMVLVVGLVAGVGYVVVNSGHASSCTVSPIMQNSCHPLLASYVQGYDLNNQGFANTGPSIAQTQAAETRAGRNFDVIHTSYHEGATGDTLTPEEIYFATKTNQTVFLNWWPTRNWAQGGTSAINGVVDAMANSIINQVQKVSPNTKLFVTIQHEPNDKVSKLDSPNDSSCAANVSLPGGSGTPAQYRAMWANVENRFKADGVKDVVWSILFESFNQSNVTAFPNCLDQALYPGNQYIDWVGYDTYGNGAAYTGKTGTGAFQETAGKTYQFLESLSGNSKLSTFGMMNKPAAIGEFNSCRSGYTPAQNAAYFQDAKYALDNHLYPDLQLYMVFDAPGQGGSAPGGCQLGYTNGGAVVPGNVVQNAFNAFGNDAIFGSTKVTTTPTPTPKPTNTPTPKPTTTTTPKPTTGPTSTPIPGGGPSPSPTPTVIPLPPPGQNGGPTPTVSGNIDIAPTDLPANADGTQCFVDGNPVPSCDVNTNNLSNGDHTVEAQTTTTSGNTITQDRTIVVKNHKNAWQTLVAGVKTHRGASAFVVLVLLCLLLWYLNYRFDLMTRWRGLH